MLYVIGLGPGNPEYLTGEAKEALIRSDLIVGYPLYLEFVRKQFPEKEYYATPMTQEAVRCRYALAQARTREVALVCSGDAGVYGMAGPVLELLPEYPETEVTVVAGVTAALAGAAALGAPLMHDFAVISLSDRLTPLEEIRRKIESAAKSDFVVVFYNPSSKKRKDYLRMACDLLLAWREPTTVCGYVKNIGRDQPETGILTLEALRDFSADMFTTIFVGNSRTRLLNGRMVTPRGYGDKLAKAVRHSAGAGSTGTDAMPAAGESSGTDAMPAAGESSGTDAMPAAEESSGADTTPAAEDPGNGHPSEILVAAGTTEGRILCEHFVNRGQAVCAIVATEYGEEMLGEHPLLCVEQGRRDESGMEELIRTRRIGICYDAMHPFAVEAHQNLREACKKTGCAYTRVLRGDATTSEYGGVHGDAAASEYGGARGDAAATESAGGASRTVAVDTVDEAAGFLKSVSGNILVTTGSRRLWPFTQINHYKERVFVRVLPSEESLRACREAGFSGRQIIAMQGPFSREMNELLLREHDIRWLVTKESGTAGGFTQKTEAARAVGAGVIVIRRPAETGGIALEALLADEMRLE